MTKQHDPQTRVLVALNASRRDYQALELAASLAARKRVELLAVFVEDINLFNLAELPFAKEIVRASAVERELVFVREGAYSVRLTVSPGRPESREAFHKPPRGFRGHRQV